MALRAESFTIDVQRATATASFVFVMHGEREWQEVREDIVIVRPALASQDQPIPFERLQFLEGMKVAGVNPDLDSVRATTSATREDWDTPEEAEAWRHLQEE